MAGISFRTYRAADTHSSLRYPFEGEESFEAEKEKKNRAMGYPTARFCGLGPFYRVEVSVPSMDGWLPLLNRAKNALFGEFTVNVLVYPVKVTRRLPVAGVEVISV